MISSARVRRGAVPVMTAPSSPADLSGGHEPGRERVVQIADVGALFEQVAHDRRCGDEIGAISCSSGLSAPTAAMNVPGAMWARSRNASSPACR